MFEIDRLIILAIDEDIGDGDITTSSIIAPGKLGKAHVIAKEDLVLAGIEIFGRVFRFLTPEVNFKTFFKDGDQIKSNSIIAEVSCDVVNLLQGERVALNFLQRLSGIASLTHKYVRRVKPYGAKIADTRKTTPGWRALEKYAVKMGGGTNHRSGLYDAVLIKDNHISVCGGVSQAVERAMANIPHTLKIEVEVRNLDELREALESGVDIIMLDNMDTKEMEKAVQLIDKKALVEASGGINLNTVTDVARTGVDIISVGAITHSATACDISMNIV